MSALPVFACVLAASSFNSSADLAAAELKSFDCMQVTSCAAVAQAFAIGAKASRRFDAPNIGLNA
jgi:hypothetical protein